MKDVKIGSNISFGGYNWCVLDIKNDAALIITEGIIEQRSYHNAYKDITWAECSLRKYLNGEFYDKFNATDKAKIIQVKNKNPDNQWYGTNGGADTRDRIFLLSLEEVACKYFGDSSSRWLRSPGRVSVKTVYIHGDGNIGIQGNNILKGNISDGECKGGVRPALWVKL
ncbi:MAG: DUF6273 domain-containing protein [Fibromonadaceae bacterium]|jgi:hypothetical protein|nr:DUF6273 domain-containing protein [Fibromonadaceae bacterium]